MLDYDNTNVRALRRGFTPEVFNTLTVIPGTIEIEVGAITSGLPTVSRPALTAPPPVQIEVGAITAGAPTVSQPALNVITPRSMWVTDRDGAEVFEFPNPADLTTFTTRSLPSGATNPRGLTMDEDGHLWVAENARDELLEFPDPTDLTVFTRRSAPAELTGIQGASFDPSGHLWVLDWVGKEVFEFPDPTDLTTFTRRTLPSTLVNPQGMSFDIAGHLWVVDQSGRAAFEFADPTDLATFTRHSLPATLVTARGVSFDSSGSMWVVDDDGNEAFEFPDPTDLTVFTTRSFPASLTSPLGVTFDYRLRREPVEIEVGAITAGNPTVSSPALTVPPPVQIQVGAITAGAPTVSSPALTTPPPVDVEVGAVTSGLPTVSSPALIAPTPVQIQVGAITSGAPTVSQPELTTPPPVQIQVGAITAGAPTVSSPALTFPPPVQIEVGAITSGAPTVSRPQLTTTSAIQIQVGAITAGAPTVSQPALTVGANLQLRHLCYIVVDADGNKDVRTFSLWLPADVPVQADRATIYAHLENILQEGDQVMLNKTRQHHRRQRDPAHADRAGRRGRCVRCAGADPAGLHEREVGEVRSGGFGDHRLPRRHRQRIQRDRHRGRGEPHRAGGDAPFAINDDRIYDIVKLLLLGSEHVRPVLYDTAGTEVNPLDDEGGNVVAYILQDDGTYQTTEQVPANRVVIVASEPYPVTDDQVSDVVSRMLVGSANVQPLYFDQAGTQENPLDRDGDDIMGAANTIVLVATPTYNVADGQLYRIIKRMLQGSPNVAVVAFDEAGTKDNPLDRAGTDITGTAETVVIVATPTHTVDDARVLELLRNVLLAGSNVRLFHFIEAGRYEPGATLADGTRIMDIPAMRMVIEATPTFDVDDARVYELLKLIMQEGSNVTLTPNDTDQEIEISATATYNVSDERLFDILKNMLLAGEHIALHRFDQAGTFPAGATLADGTETTEIPENSIVITSTIAAVAGPRGVRVTRTVNIEAPSRRQTRSAPLPPDDEQLFPLASKLGQFADLKAKWFTGSPAFLRDVSVPKEAELAPNPGTGDIDVDVNRGRALPPPTSSGSGSVAGARRRGCRGAVAHR